jgi:hypothetical protein
VSARARVRVRDALRVAGRTGLLDRAPAVHGAAAFRP